LTSGKKTKKMAKKKLKTWANYTPEKGVENTGKSLTMPDMSNDPRTVLENHVRGINPITGAVLDRQRYYGDAILPYNKDLTYEELRMQREALNQKVAELNQKLKPQEDEATEVPGQTSSTDNGLGGNESSGTTDSI
jgi:hypothetical protein